MGKEKNKIDRMLDDMSDYLESCKPSLLSGSKVVVSKDEIYDLMDALRMAVPDEIKKSRKVLENSDTIIAEARKKAQEILDEAGKQASKYVEESVIVEEAYKQADEILADAEARANEEMAAASRDAGDIRTGAMAYANDLLAEVEKILGHAYDTTRTRSQNLVESIQSNLEILKSNRSEIAAQLGEAINNSEPQTPEEENRNASGNDGNSDFVDYRVDLKDADLYNESEATLEEATSDNFDYEGNMNKSVEELQVEAGLHDEK